MCAPWMGEGFGEEGTHVSVWLSSSAVHCKIKSLKFERQILTVEEHPRPVTAPPPCEACHLLFNREDTEPKRLARGGQLAGDRVGIPPRAVWTQSLWWWLCVTQMSS